MKKRRFSLLCLLFTCTIWTGCSNINLQKHPSLLKFKPLNFSIPKAERIVLDNGMIVFLLEDHELPLFNMNIIIRTGAVYEPDNKAGLASITGNVMRTGGTKFLTGDEINEELEFIAGSIETAIGEESGKASLSVLKKDTDKGLKLLFDILQYPVFDQKKIDLKKQQILESLRRQNDNPSSISHREFSKIIYKEHPYGRLPTVKTINNISRDDLVNFHKKYYIPGNMMVGITGDFNKSEIINKLKLLINNKKNQKVDFPEIKPLDKHLEKSTNYIFKDINQTVIRIGHLGIKHNNPDKFTLKILNYILGGGSFQSRLMKEIRADKGLAYAIGSSFSPGYREPGIFKISCETKVSSSSEVIGLILENIKRIRDNPVTDEELEISKKYITNSFIFKFTSNNHIVNQLMSIEYYGLPLDYLENYRKNINKVTKEGLLKAAQKYLHPDKLTLLVVGNKDKFDKPLSNFGNVKTIKLDKPITDN